MAQRYELNEKDIDSVIHYLKLTDPKNATPEKAIELLEELQAGAHMLAHDNPELLERLNQELQQSQSKSKVNETNSIK